jgi:F0F1-type ATP synthase assembly protein I
MNADEQQQSESAIKAIAPYMSLGIQLALSVVVLFFIGHWLDSMFNTGHWCAVGGALIGAGGGLYKFINCVGSRTAAREKRCRTPQPVRIKENKICHLCVRSLLQ